MADLVTLTINGAQVQAQNGALLIDVAKKNGIEIPAFCYYEGLSLQAACRMCLVEVEKMPKLAAGCTLPVAEGMVVQTESPAVVKARKTTLEFLLTNHPLDCPVCDKGGECELQDMVFKYGAGESRYTEIKHHVDEKQWSPVVYYDGPRCILCYRCVRICDEGLGVKALGVTNRGAYSEITPNMGDHLNCLQCGACIDICPVGALTSGTYRYQTRPWEMAHVGTICTHCGDGCKTTLGVRGGGEIIRGNNRDRSGINGEFLCVKGRYAFDFVHNAERLQAPLIRKDGKLVESGWAEALSLVASKFAEAKAAGGKIGVIGSSRTTNEENFYLQKFARQGLGTPHIDHRRSGDVPALLDALSGRENALATAEGILNAKAVLVIGADLTQQHPLIAYHVRTAWRLGGARTYVVTPGPVAEDKFAAQSARATAGQEMDALRRMAEALKGEQELTVIFGDSIRGAAVKELVGFVDALGVKAQYVCLVDYSNSRGACDMGLMPDLGPGYHAAAQKGMTAAEMLNASDLAALWVVGANPLESAALASANCFVVVQEMFLTETAQKADVVLPAASAYEKSGTVTNTCGQVQRISKAGAVMGAKADLDIFGLLAHAMGLNLGPAKADKIFEEIRQNVRGYNLPLPVIATGGAAQAVPLNGRVPFAADAAIRSAGDTLFTSGSLGRYSKILNSVLEAPGELYRS
jgi:NADH-quinone oxidoreductase subunit G